MRRTMWMLMLSAVAAFPLAACKNDTADTTPEIRPVRTEVVDPKPIEDDRQAVGEIRPRHESDLGFRVSGKLVSRSVDVGAIVKQGDVLAHLDQGDFENKLRSAEADVTSAEAVLVESQATEDRQKQLLERAVTPQANYDAALKNRRSALAKLDSAKAALALAQDQLKYTSLVADHDGIVTAVGAEPGQVVSVGQMVVRLAKPDEVDAVFNIAESAFRDRNPNERPQIVVSLLSSPGITCDGVVREVSPVADPATRTYQVKVTLTDPPAAMRFGASVLGRLKETTAPVVVLPGSALYDKAGKTAVWIYDAAQSTVSLKPVTVARYETDRVVISGGLTKGDIVVTAGVNRLRESQKVKLIADAKP